MEDADVGGFALVVVVSVSAEDVVAFIVLEADAVSFVDLGYCSFEFVDGVGVCRVADSDVRADGDGCFDVEVVVSVNTVALICHRYCLLHEGE